MSKISLLIPAYMESGNLPKLTKELKEALRGEDFEAIIVNDTNLDGSDSIIEELKKEYRDLKNLSSDKRRGKTRAIKEGFDESEGDIIVVLDADLQYSPKDIPALIEALKQADVVTGVRVNRQDSIQRKAESKIYNALIRLLFHVDFSDCNSGLKVFKRNALEAIVHEMKDGWHRYMLVLAAKKGYNVLERPVTHLKRIVGQSKYTSPFKLFKGLCDIIAVAVYLHKCKR